MGSRAGIRGCRWACFQTTTIQSGLFRLKPAPAHVRCLWQVTCRRAQAQSTSHNRDDRTTVRYLICQPTVTTMPLTRQHALGRTQSLACSQQHAGKMRSSEAPKATTCHPASAFQTQLRHPRAPRKQECAWQSCSGPILRSERRSSQLTKCSTRRSCCTGMSSDALLKVCGAC